MSDIWPPPPENQPDIVASAPSLRRRLASVVSSGLLYSCLGTLMLLSPVLAAIGLNFSPLRFLAHADLFFGGLALFGVILVIVGGCLGYTVRNTANGFAALFASSAIFCLVFGAVLLRFLL